MALDRNPEHAIVAFVTFGDGSLMQLLVIRNLFDGEIRLPFGEDQPHDMDADETLRRVLRRNVGLRNLGQVQIRQIGQTMGPIETDMRRRVPQYPVFQFQARIHFDQFIDHGSIDIPDAQIEACSIPEILRSSKVAPCFRDLITKSAPLLLL